MRRGFLYLVAVMDWATLDEAYGKIQAPPCPELAPDRANPEHKLAA